MLDASLIAPERLRPLRRSEYDRMVELGLFQDERVELLQGALVQMSPQGPAHAEAVAVLNELFSSRLGSRGRLRAQAPLAISDDSEPEPDIAIVPPGKYGQAHPTTALLVVEVSGTSVRKDRDLKAALYANAGIPEYWLIDLEARRLEVRSAPAGGKYSHLTTHASGTVSPLAFPDIAVTVAELFS